MGVTTASTDSPTTMANNIKNITTSVSITTNHILVNDSNNYISHFKITPANFKTVKITVTSQSSIAAKYSLDNQSSWKTLAIGSSVTINSSSVTTQLVVVPNNDGNTFITVVVTK